jgi:hypothetical protein
VRNLWTALLKNQKSFKKGDYDCVSFNDLRKKID